MNSSRAREVTERVRERGGARRRLAESSLAATIEQRRDMLAGMSSVMAIVSRAGFLGVIAVVMPLAVVACKKQHVATADSCNALLESAGKAVEKAHVEASSGARCMGDADCVESPTARCTTGCGGYAVSTRSTAMFEAAVKSVDDGACKRWDDDGCATIAPRSMPSCPSYVPRCKDHACEMVDRRAP